MIKKILEIVVIKKILYILERNRLLSREYFREYKRVLIDYIVYIIMKIRHKRRTTQKKRNLHKRRTNVIKKKQQKSKRKRQKMNKKSRRKMTRGGMGPFDRTTRSVVTATTGAATGAATGATTRLLNASKIMIQNATQNGRIAVAKFWSARNTLEQPTELVTIHKILEAMIVILERVLYEYEKFENEQELIRRTLKL